MNPPPSQSFFNFLISLLPTDKEGSRTDADGVIEDCIANIKHVYERFGKESMIVETGFEVNEQVDLGAFGSDEKPTKIMQAYVEASGR